MRGEGEEGRGDTRHLLGSLDKLLHCRLGVQSIDSRQTHLDSW